MTLQQQVCSLELAKRLKELGIKQESLFYYNPPMRWTMDGSESHIEGGLWTITDGKMNNCEHGLKTSAFTVAELGEMLGRRHLPQHFSDGWRLGPNQGFVIEPCDTEADARAKMLIYLLDNKLIPCSQS